MNLIVIKDNVYMLKNISNFIFPPYCSICDKRGFYICPKCKKLFKKNLPECYICRRISNGFKTHEKCKCSYSFSSVFVAWEYNNISSGILKRFKYKGISDISQSISIFFCNTLLNSSFKNNLKDTLLIPVPSSLNKLRDRGFNQTELIAKDLNKRIGIDINLDLIQRINNSKSHALMDKSERINSFDKSFIIKNKIDIEKYKSITILDDVITTGSTLESISELIYITYGKDIQLQAICMFRGKPYYKS